MPAHRLHIQHSGRYRHNGWCLAGIVFVVVVVLAVGVGIHAVRVLPIGHVVVAMITAWPLNNAPHKTYRNAGNEDHSSKIFCHE